MLVTIIYFVEMHFPCTFVTFQWVLARMCCYVFPPCEWLDYVLHYQSQLRHNLSDAFTGAPTMNAVVSYHLEMGIRYVLDYVMDKGKFVHNYFAGYAFSFIDKGHIFGIVSDDTAVCYGWMPYIPGHIPSCFFRFACDSSFCLDVKAVCPFFKAPVDNLF